MDLRLTLSDCRWRCSAALQFGESPSVRPPRRVQKNRGGWFKVAYREKDAMPRRAIGADLPGLSELLLPRFQDPH